MATVEFTPNLSRQTTAVRCEAPGNTVAEVLATVFDQVPTLKGYLVDDQGAVRQHVVIFLDGIAIKDRRHLTDPTQPESEIFVMQALSGG
jgi:molybdopterin synthase sulfur carrier subunit